MSRDIEAVIEKAVSEAFSELDGLYGGWFTPDELDLTIEALEHYAHRKAKSDPDKAKQTTDLLKAMKELREEGDGE